MEQILHRLASIIPCQSFLLTISFMRSILIMISTEEPTEVGCQRFTMRLVHAIIVPSIVRSESPTRVS